MFETFTQKQFRLGDLLVEKHLITAAQLNTAIALQQQQPGVHLGQMLIELGYISAGQLHRALLKQNSLRRVARILTLMAVSSTGIATTACSDSAASGDNTAAITQPVGTPATAPSSDPDVAVTAPQSTDNDTTASTTPAPAPSPSSASAPFPASSPAPSPASAAIKAIISWIAPTQREDGSPLDASDIDYYEIYYTAQHSGAVEVIRITDINTLSHEINNLPTDTYQFAMVATDRNGRASGMSSLVEVDLL